MERRVGGNDRAEIEGRILRNFHDFADKWKFRSPLTTLPALLVDLVQGMPSSIAISFPRGLALAAVDGPAPRQSAKVGESDHLLVMARGGGASLPFLPLGLATVPPVATQFSPAIVPVTAVLPRQAAVQVLRGRVHPLPERSLVSTTLHEHYAIRFRRAASLLTALGPTAQMFPEPLSQSTAATVVPCLVNHPRRRRIPPVLAPATRKEKNRCSTMLKKSLKNFDRSIDFSENEFMGKGG